MAVKFFSLVNTDLFILFFFPLLWLPALAVGQMPGSVVPWGMPTLAASAPTVASQSSRHCQVGTSKA